MKIYLLGVKMGTRVIAATGKILGFGYSQQ
jgi:hypothetical protein